MDMDIKKLFKMQKGLRNKIIGNHRLENVKLLPYFLLALRVELGELANAWRWFKIWSIDRKMNRDVALEEYADCLSFILEVGLELNAPQYIKPKRGVTKYKDPLIQFNRMFMSVSDLEGAEIIYGNSAAIDQYEDLLITFLDLGDMLGFTKKEMIDAYYKKNEINHKRQAEGY